MFAIQVLYFRPAEMIHRASIKAKSTQHGSSLLLRGVLPLAKNLNLLEKTNFKMCLEVTSRPSGCVTSFKNLNLLPGGGANSHRELIKPYNDGTNLCHKLIKPHHDGVNLYHKLIKSCHGGVNLYRKLIKPYHDGANPYHKPIKPYHDGANSYTIGTLLLYILTIPIAAIIILLKHTVTNSVYFYSILLNGGNFSRKLFISA